MIHIEVPDQSLMQQLGGKLALLLNSPCIIYLNGPLGAGKTTLVRGMLHALGHQGAVKSPTYTLVEPYELEAFTCYHFDLYRLNDSEELEAMGIRDYLLSNAVCMIEWPEKGAGFLPLPDLEIEISYHKSDSTLRDMVLKTNNVQVEKLFEQKLT